MANDWFSKIDPKAPKYYKQVHNIMNREFINTLKEENPELKGIREADIIGLVRDFHKEAVVPYVLNNRAPLELPFLIGDVFIGIIKKDYLSIYFTATKTLIKGVTRYMWDFKGDTDFRKKMWQSKSGKKWKKFIRLEYKNNVTTAIKAEKNHIQYKSVKKKVDLSNYDEFEMSI